VGSRASHDEKIAASAKVFLSTGNSLSVAFKRNDQDRSMGCSNARSLIFRFSDKESRRADLATWLSNFASLQFTGEMSRQASNYHLLQKGRQAD
jgi:hypothetical protein